MRFPKSFSPFLIASLIFAPGGAFAAKAAISFDFGNGPGKVTAPDSGFTVNLIDKGQSGLLEYTPESLVLTAVTGRFQNLGFLQGFVGMRAADGYDFVVSTRTTIHSFAGSNNRRWGIHLFAEEDLNETGLCALVIGNNADGNRLLVFRRGLNGKNIASAVFGEGGFTEGETYTFTVTGDYVGENDLNVTLSLTDGVTTTDLTTTVDRNDYPGVLTGASARLRKGWAISFHNYSIRIP